MVLRACLGEHSILVVAFAAAQRGSHLVNSLNHLHRSEAPEHLSPRNPLRCLRFTPSCYSTISRMSSYWFLGGKQKRTVMSLSCDCREYPSWRSGCASYLLRTNSS